MSKNSEKPHLAPRNPQIVCFCCRENLKSKIWLVLGLHFEWLRVAVPPMWSWQCYGDRQTLPGGRGNRGRAWAGTGRQSRTSSYPCWTLAAHSPRPASPAAAADARSPPLESPGQRHSTSRPWKTGVRGIQGLAREKYEKCRCSHHFCAWAERLRRQNLHNESPVCILTFYWFRASLYLPSVFWCRKTVVCVCAYAKFCVHGLVYAICQFCISLNQLNVIKCSEVRELGIGNANRNLTSLNCRGEIPDVFGIFRYFARIFGREVIW